MQPAPRSAQIIPFPAMRRQMHQMPPSIDGEFAEDDMPDLLPELFDADEDREELAVYIHMADTWDD